MSYLLANGCSFTDKNYNTKSLDYHHTEEERKQLGIPLNDWKMWPEYVADKLELLHMNLARSGGSNSRMYKTTAEQIEMKKPEVVMHLWTGGYRNDLLNYTLNDYTYIMAIEIANALYECNAEYISWYAKNKPAVEFRLAFDLIKHYYPEKYEKCKDFYISIYNPNEDMHSIERIFKKTSYWVDRSSIYFFCEYYLDMQKSGKITIQEKIKHRISNELEPLLRLYELCKMKDIPLITVGALGLGGHVGHYTDNRKLSDQSNIFQSMILGLVKTCDNLNLNWFNNIYFKLIDDLVFEEKYILYNWPNNASLQPKSHRMDQWLNGWKTVSHQDSHPHWDTQKLIGDLFYDLYEKNYS